MLFIEQQHIYRNGEAEVFVGSIISSLKGQGTQNKGQGQGQES